MIAPMVCCCGVCVPMISVGFGHTAERSTSWSLFPDIESTFDRRVSKRAQRVGYAMAGQTAELAPRQEMYALRDATATIKAIR